MVKMRRIFGSFIALVLICSCMTSCSAQELNFSATADAPIITVHASSLLNAAKASFLFLNGEGKRDESVMQTCAVYPLTEIQESSLGEATDLELLIFRTTFTYQEKDNVLSAGLNFVRMQIAPNEDGTYSLLSYYYPASGMDLHKDVTNHFSKEAASIIMSKQDELLQFTEAMTEDTWLLFKDKEKTTNQVIMIDPASTERTEALGEAIDQNSKYPICEYAFSSDGIENAVWIEY